MPAKRFALTGDETFRVTFSGAKRVSAYCSTPEVAAGLARYFGTPAVLSVYRHNPVLGARVPVARRKLSGADVFGKSWEPYVR